MPFYRVNGVMVHVKLAGKKAPAPCCATVRVKAGPTAVLTRCRGISSFLCDHEYPDGKTCDAPLCTEHAKQIGKDRHLCPRHAAEHAQREPELF